VCGTDIGGDHSVKAIGNLFDKLTNRATLAEAAHLAAQGKRSRAEVAAFFQNFDQAMVSLQQQLANGTWRFSPYRAFQVRDTKTRTIHAPLFVDRVVHHALIAVTRSTFEKGAIHHSYACRAGRGQHQALAVAQQWTRRGTWYAKLDVCKYYDSIDHALLRQLLARRFREQRLLALFDSLFASYCTAPGKGLPIGALTSQYLSNFYLDEFDRRVLATGLVPHYLRYMDDIVIWGSEPQLAALRPVVFSEIARLQLEFKHGGEWNRCSQGLPLLGFVLYPDRVRLNAQGRKRLRKKHKQLEVKYAKGCINEAELQACSSSLFAHAQWGSDVAWRRSWLACQPLVDQQAAG
jgi:RNA-directed DNA polymerase